MWIFLKIKIPKLKKGLPFDLFWIFGNNTWHVDLITCWPRHDCYLKFQKGIKIDHYPIHKKLVKFPMCIFRLHFHVYKNFITWIFLRALKIMFKKIKINHNTKLACHIPSCATITPTKLLEWKLTKTINHVLTSSNSK
jgi:hypothetical protein